MTKFCPQHFPVGTVFELSADCVTFVEDKRLVYTVNGIVRNGLNSYVLKTGEFRLLTGAAPISIGFNIDHVGRIVARGKGPVRIDHIWYGIDRPLPGLKQDIRLNQVEFELRHGKGYVSTYSPFHIVHWELLKVAKPGDAFRLEALVGDLIQQTWCIKVKDNVLHGLYIYHINRKRMRKWLKQNMNRYLVNYAKQTKIDNEAFEELMDDDDWDPYLLWVGKNIPHTHASPLPFEEFP